MLSAIVGGTISVIVAVISAAVARLSRPRFVLRQKGDSDYALLTNKGWRAVAIGNSCFLGAGGDLRLAEDPDEPVTGAYLRPNRSIAVILDGQPPGATLTFTYLPMWWRSCRTKKENKVREELKASPPFSPKAHGLSKWKEYSVPVTF